jgi:dephospho-CoA kinase
MSGPLIIGLTGSIAAGKSTVGGLLAARGALHCDADKLVHKLYDPGTPGFEKVVAHFGQEVVGSDGYIDRKVLGSKVFGKPDEMRALTEAMGSITELVHSELDSWHETLGEGDIAVMEAVNLMEPGYATKCHQTWLIGVSEDIARRRLKETRGMTDEEAASRLASQRPFEARAGGADWTYMNDGTPEELEAAVDAELKRIRALHAEGKLPASVFDAWWERFKEEAKAAAEKKKKKTEEARASN